jgi:hypothetical protein
MTTKTRQQGREEMIANAARQFDPMIAQLVEKAWDSGAVYERERAEQAIAEVLRWYPTDIFPEDGTSIDSKCARMARKTCENILAEYRSENETK